MHTQVEFGVSANTGSPRSTPRGATLAKLRRYISEGNHLRDREQPPSPDNVKFLDEIASEVGYARGSNVSRALRREFPEVAAEINKRSWFPNQKAPKKERFFRYIEEGQHLRDPEGELSAANLKTQYEIADEVGTNQKNTSELLREYFPAIAAVMTNRKRYDQEE